MADDRFCPTDSPIYRDFGTDPFVSLSTGSSKTRKLVRGDCRQKAEVGTDLKDLKECKILFVSASERAHIDD